jgi:hypothetical protein
MSVCVCSLNVPACKAHAPYRIVICGLSGCRLRLKRDGTRAETRFRVSAKRTSPFKSAGASVQSTTGSRGVRISGSDAGYTMFQGSVKSTGYPLNSPVSLSLSLPCVTGCHHISNGLYHAAAKHCFIWTVRSSLKKLLNTKYIFWSSLQLLSEIFMVTPCINDIKHFIIQLMHTM